MTIFFTFSVYLVFDVVPFGETVLYRMPEVARDRHQALEERWTNGVWLGHARSTNSALVATDEGIIKARGRRAPVGYENCVEET